MLRHLGVSLILTHLITFGNSSQNGEVFCYSLCADIVLRLFTYDFRLRPDIYAVLATAWMKVAARSDMSDLRDMAMEGYRQRKEREKEKEREREKDKERSDRTSAARNMRGRTQSM